jgi:hypothetical protein
MRRVVLTAGVAIILLPGIIGAWYEKVCGGECNYYCVETTTCDGSSSTECGYAYLDPTRCTSQAGKNEWNPDGWTWYSWSIGGTQRVDHQPQVCYRHYPCSYVSYWRALPGPVPFWFECVEDTAYITCYKCTLGQPVNHTIDYPQCVDCGGS